MRNLRKNEKKQSLVAFAQKNASAFRLLLCGAVCFFLYYGATHKKSELIAELQKTIEELEETKKLSLEEREDLVLQLHSREDDAWIEMVLKKRLGVVPEGQMKVYFPKDD